MTILAAFIILIVLFYALGKAADLVIYNARIAGERLHLKLIFVGLLTGFLTSLPEVAVTVNSIFEHTEQLALGNLIGGIMVLYGLVLALSIIFNRKVETSGEWGRIVPLNIYLFSPFILGADGMLSAADGMILIAGYLALVAYLYFLNREAKSRSQSTVPFTFKNLIYAVIGLILVVIISFAVLRLAEYMLQYVNFTRFFFGLVIFSVGTNLPEVIVAFRSWKRHVGRLSLGNIFGSTMSNVLIIGFLAFFRPLKIIFDVEHLVFASFMIALLSLVVFFYVSGKRFSRNEGGVLLALYLLFVFVSLICIACNVI
ncbi:MAG: hypothetical protein COT81_00225 [Candidatus Buchananbacteria bacterium CG10_big_fil_rev_8_21_14_0_10_42_9]|uniref:Sodium/calcium exchanger membrane region domain-containing protein n=1 Tax=Candidatus Buchananbacteria bacterium CG10_big_fil_rev_8_21_14_0_10_42_9 TaxID=1974526 RepID=A0A2H0W2K4_9BACT|nr:MAG: hypothetical protein COT81_00225 [Candidatus Buchananbacteria bacterium CG10_big_fil_rev_8_21_14_0_10_42_9]